MKSPSDDRTTTRLISRFALIRAALGVLAIGMGIYAALAATQAVYGLFMLGVGGALLAQSRVVARRRRQ